MRHLIFSRLHLSCSCAGIGLVLLLSAGSPAAAASKPASLLADPGFERVAHGRAAGWEPYDRGYALDATIRHSGDYSIRCTNAGDTGGSGAAYALVLNQKKPAPLLVTGWSRAEGVGGISNGEYAIYVDLEYMDGTPLWGQVAPFTVGTHGWERKQVLILPSKPLRSARIYALFRNHRGAAWFDDFNAVALSGGLFDLQPLSPPLLPPGRSRGWFARDVAARSPIVPLADSAGRPAREAARLGLRLSDLHDRSGGRIETAVLEDTTGKPRAVTAYYVERFDAAGGSWWNDIRHHLPVSRSGESANLARIAGTGAVGALSLYPFGCVTTARKGRAVGLPPELGPKIARIAYNAGSRLLYVAIDVELDGKNQANSDGRGHGRAEVGVARYDVDPRWGFRDAAATFYHLFPDAFARRSKAEGIWIPFTDPSTVERVNDFGIAYHEGDNSIASDDRLGILSFRYTEPMTYWMPMAPSIPRTYADALARVRRQAAGPDGEPKRSAEAVLNSGSYDAGGRFNVEFRNEPWADGAVWTLNPNPRLPARNGQSTKSTLNYTKEKGDRMYRSGARGIQDGEYLDSIEGWADVLDFRPESIRYSRFPPTFATDTARPVVPTFFSVYEFAARLRDDLHGRGKLLMANSTPWRFNAFAPLLDVMGTETDWLPGGAWHPDSDEVFDLRRTLCHHKPYLLLQNTDFDRFGSAQVERYFQRSMFYGVYPSMFSANAATHPYWETPSWYNRDRPLFIKYIPAIRRLSAAGWEPVTDAVSDHSSVFLERFGREYLTVMNDSSAPVQATVALDLSRWHPGWARQRRSKLRLIDLISGKTVAEAPAASSARLSVSLESGEARALNVVLFPVDGGPPSAR